MSETTRIIKLYNLLRAGQAYSIEHLQEALGISRAQIYRDLKVLREQLNIPIIKDGVGEKYRLDLDPNRIGPINEIPGLWLDKNESYALLTLLNIFRDIDPGFLATYLSPLRYVLKRAILSSETGGIMRGFDRKFSAELPSVAIPDRSEFPAISEALIEDKRLSLEIESSAGESISGEYSPQRIVITTEGWMLDLFCHKTEKLERVNLKTIKSAKVLNIEATQISFPE